MHQRLAPGTRVETIKPKVESKDWTPEAKLLRKWGVSGVITDTSDAHGICYEVEHEDKTTAWYEPRELLPIEPYTYTPEERAEMIRKMQRIVDVFYPLASAAGCHAFIEFTGLMTEFVKVCADAHARGQQFPFANTHSGEAMPFKPYHLKYLGEKLNCIYGPALLTDATNRQAFIDELFGGAFKLVPVAPSAEDTAEDFSDLSV